MGEIAKLYVLLGADINDLKKKMSDAQRHLYQVGKNFQKVGKKLTLGLTVPLIGMGVAAVKAFGDFDKAMTESLAIMGNVSDTMRKDMADAARAMSEERHGRCC